MKGSIGLVRSEGPVGLPVLTRWAVMLRQVEAWDLGLCEEGDLEDDLFRGPGSGALVGCEG